MEELKILREKQFFPFPIEIYCEKIDEGYQILTNPTWDDFVRCPVIKETGKPFSEHPMLRPFDKFLFSGDPNIGKVTHIFLLYQKINRPAMVCSIVQIKKRILILPAWGISPMKPLSKQKVKAEIPVAHITIDEDIKGNFKIHYTGAVTKDEKKVKNYPKNKLDMKNEHGLHIGTLGVNELKNLDPLGIVYRDLADDELLRNDVKEVEPILQKALSPVHPLCKLPQESIWDNKHHLEISFALIGSKLNNVKYPKDEIIRHEEGAVEQLTKIPLDAEKSLPITFTMCPGKLSNSYQWKRSKR
ncbi:MAG: hypothetical protein SYNGOMJ08_00063 [Candidatus Syntrophoarchaeum sp. GoM_oil]|nr:MAG: hypothetical protein SYNGOMJ08_00063 [Candidatus Syntrophoarchaeum sp. GoM_oil]